MSDLPDIRRGLFGTRKRDLRRLLENRETMLRHVEQRARSAESDVERLQVEVSTMKEEGIRVEEQLRSLREKLEELLSREERAPETPREVAGPPPRPSSTPRDLTASFVSEEIPAILAAAEQSAARIVEGARNAAEQLMGQARRAWQEAQVEVTRLRAWRERLEPVIRTALSQVHDVRARIEEVPARIQRALGPVADAVAAIDVNLEELLQASTPPSVETPLDLPSEPDAAEGSVTDEPGA